MIEIVSGVAAGSGAVLMVRGFRRPGLQDVLDRYSGAESTTPTGIVSRMSRASLRVFAPTACDLEVTETSLERHAFDRLVCAVASMAIPVACGIVMRLGGVRLPAAVLLIASLGCAALGLGLAAHNMRQQADRMRRAMRSSLSGYLDVVAIMLAGGAGIETALTAASRVGNGPMFDLMNRILVAARSTRRSPWDVMAEEGRRIGLRELPELAANVKLGGEQGARMTASLVAKAESLRAGQMAEIEAAANSSTERMGLPMVLMFISFLVLLGYPAMHLISRGF